MKIEIIKVCPYCHGKKKFLYYRCLIPEYRRCMECRETGKITETIEVVSYKEIK